MPTAKGDPGRLTEAAFQRQVLDLAKLCGWRTYHTHDSRRSQPGFPDIVLVNPKRRHTLFVELKTDVGRVTAAQQAWIDDLRRAGANVHLWRPADWTAIVEILGAGR